jgi:NhaP-type Na+/H+ or K+/H+ antiporter
LRLLCIGLPLTIALATVASVALLSDLELWECAIVAAVLAPTDAALGQAVVSDPALPLRIRQGRTRRPAATAASGHARK